MSTGVCMFIIFVDCSYILFWYIIALGKCWFELLEWVLMVNRVFTWANICPITVYTYEVCINYLISNLKGYIRWEEAFWILCLRSCKDGILCLHFVWFNLEYFCTLLCNLPVINLEWFYVHCVTNQFGIPIKMGVDNLGMTLLCVYILCKGTGILWFFKNEDPGEILYIK